MKNLKDFIIPVAEALPSGMCKSMIAKFEEKNTFVERDEAHFKFKELNLSKAEEFESEVQHLTATNTALYKLYKEKLGANYLPKHYSFEEFRMKKYEPNGEDCFDWHVDVGNHDTAKRCLVFLYYLNDVKVGGETLFSWSRSDLTADRVEAKEGGAVVFPPSWLFPHKGAAPISGPKYIISSYVHYL